MRRLWLCLWLIPVSLFATDRAPYWPDARYEPSIPTAETVLGAAIGDRITPPADVRRYFDALAETAPERIRVVPYGTTWEGRELFYAVVASAQNLARLDDFEDAMAALADPRVTDEATAERLIAATPGSVWLAYAVHGNEISSTDAAMLTAYHLLASQGDEVVDRILAETVVFLNPLQNPDGRDRFVRGFEMARGLEPDPSPLSAEHIESWPSGRVNHYLFDMNRDWISIHQPETLGHVRALRRALPLVFVDLHEMGSNSTYYFAPEAVPYNPLIAADQRASLEIFGRNNAHWFDRFGIDYFTREVFDAFYPGYGASWPLYYGAVAMTYEQASVRGLVMQRRDGSVMPYRESVRNHFVTSISTADAVAKNRELLLQRFYDYRRDAVAAGRGPSGGEFLVSGRPDPTTADKLAGLLVRHGVEVRRATAAFEACDRRYEAGSYAISLAQPSHRLIRTLLDPQVAMEDDFLAEQERRRAKDLGHEIYDITAWSLPLMFNVEVDRCGVASRGDFEKAGPELVLPGRLESGAAEIAYLVPWGTQGAARLLAAALRQDLAVKTSDEPFQLGGRSYPAGSLIFKVPSNPGDLEARLAELARQTGADVYGTSDSWVDEGPNFGSSNVLDVPPPRIALAWDEPTSPYSAGATRFVLERQIGYPVTVVRTATLARGDLRRFSVLLLPEQSRRYGSYAERLGAEGLARLARWVEDGGVLISLGNATRLLADPEADLLALRREDAARDEVVRDADAESESATVPGSLLADAEALATAIAPTKEAPDSLPGALVRARVDPDHWLAAGLPSTVHVMARGSDIYAPISLDRGRNVLHFADRDHLLASGYLWQQNRDQLAFKPFVVTQQKGDGWVIGFTQDPTFRAYMDGLNVLLANAVFRGAAHATPPR